LRSLSVPLSRLIPKALDPLRPAAPPAGRAVGQPGGATLPRSASIHTVSRSCGCCGCGGGSVVGTLTSSLRDFVFRPSKVAAAGAARPAGLLAFDG